MSIDLSPDSAAHYTKTGDCPKIGRRTLIAGVGAAAAAVVATPWIREWFARPAPVFLARGQRYDGPLEQTIADGLIATGVVPDSLRGRKVLLKPNLVEPSRLSPHVTTHPAMIVAAAEVFRRWGAEVVVGEAPGHLRDTELALVESGLAEGLDSADLDFRDLNYEESVWTKNLGRTSKLSGFYFPRSVAEADLVVSMPKLKTHHWVGMTASLKNMYGVLPGIQYGWPKNVLHHAGIPETVCDINASLAKTIAIVDGILCMEGDGPIMGTPKPLGLIAVGANLTAVDATCARVIGLEPGRVSYLKLADRRLGPVQDRLIVERGEAWRELATPFQLLDKPHLAQLRA
ncbi:MAG TPA: DUF362 domain-containing protein [Pirellulales bacterium]|nr:DUF362 domain-containing protein [Pirellulales bacterium]